jgi:hypothetical protein
MLKMANDEHVSLKLVSVNMWLSLKTEIDSPLQMMKLLIWTCEHVSLNLWNWIQRQFAEHHR